MMLYLVAGLNQSLSMVALSIMLLRTSDERFRGRVMGVRMLAIYTLPIGLLAAGPLVSMVGFRGLVVLYVGLGLALLAGIALAWRDDLLPHAAAANAGSIRCRRAGAPAPCRRGRSRSCAGCRTAPSPARSAANRT
jgi:hypothetical protein